MGFIIFKALKTNHSGLSQTNHGALLQAIHGGLSQTNQGCLSQINQGGLSQTNTIVVFIACPKIISCRRGGAIHIYISTYRNYTNSRKVRVVL